MNTASSATALIASIVAGLALMFVWAGSESVYFDWVPMEDDLSLAEIAQVRSPVSAAPIYASAAETGADPAMTSGTTSPDADAVAAAMTAPGAEGPRNRVLWISIAGFRGDYLEKAEAPWLKEKVEEGRATSTLLPAFPSLHFPCLISQATGFNVTTHGIPGNRMRDPETKAIVDRPTKLALLKAEPIWTLAKRQGLGVLVHDWPFSQEQPAGAEADVFLSTYDDARTDDVRLSSMLEAWSSFKGPKKISLAMASLHDLEKAAMAHGSRHADTFTAVTKMDATLKAFFEKLRDAWPTLSNPGDRLYVIFTTDHGMADSEKVINFKELMGPLADHVDFATDAAVANIWFHAPPEGVTAEAFAKKYDEGLKDKIYWRSYPRGEYPATFKLGAGGPFLGDRMLVLKGGYSFADAKGSEPVYNPSETSGPFSGGGYPYQDSSRMKGQAIFFQLDGGDRGGDLGEVDGTQLYPTVCKLLGIDGSSAVTAKALDID